MSKKKKRYKRIKIIDRDKVKNIQQTNWERVELREEAVPDFLKKPVIEKKGRVFASGCELTNLRPGVWGGMDFFRRGINDKVSVNWKVDGYLMRDPGTGTQIFFEGPIIDPNFHHLDKIPKGYQNLEIFYYPYPKCPICGNQLDVKKSFCRSCGWNKKSKK